MLHFYCIAIIIKRNMETILFLIGRIIFGGYFLLNGINHMKNHKGITLCVVHPVARHSNDISPLPVTLDYFQLVLGRNTGENSSLAERAHEVLPFHVVHFRPRKHAVSVTVYSRAPSYSLGGLSMISGYHYDFNSGILRD